MKLLETYILLEAVESEKKTDSGIILPDAVDKTEIRKGRVLLVAEDVQRVQEGDTVLYKHYSPAKVKYEGQERILIEEEDLVALYGQEDE